MILPPVPGRALSPTPTVAVLCTAGYTRTVRPPASYTNALKRIQLTTLDRYRADRRPDDYEEDHLVPLEIGGAPSDRRNLWPQPWQQARRDDLIENQLHRDLCAGRLTVARAQAEIRLLKRRNG